MLLFIPGKTSLIFGSVIITSAKIVKHILSIYLGEHFMDFLITFKYRVNMKVFLVAVLVAVAMVRTSTTSFRFYLDLVLMMQWNLCYYWQFYLISSFLNLSPKKFIDTVLVFSSLTLNKFHTFFNAFIILALNMLVNASWEDSMLRQFEKYAISCCCCLG